jgi:MFS family permease
MVKLRRHYDITGSVAKPKPSIICDKINYKTGLPKAKISKDAWKTLAILSIITTTVMCAETMLIPAIPNLINDFNTSYGTSSWVIGSYLIFGAVMTPIAGKLSDIYGRKKVLLTILGIYIIGVSAAAFSNDIMTLIISRSIQGTGGSTFPIVFGIIQDKFPREKISIGQGVIASMFAAGSIIGLSIGGVIIEHFGWRMTFLAILPISIMLLIAINRYIHIGNCLKAEKPRELSNSEDSENNIHVPQKNGDAINISFLKHIKEKISESNAVVACRQYSIQLDIPGSIALSATIISLLLVLTMLNSNPTDISRYMNNDGRNTTATGYPVENSIILIVASIVSFIAFIKIEKQSKNPLVDFALFHNKLILLSCLIVMIVGMSMYMVVFLTLPILLQTPEPIGFGEDAISTGLMQLPFAIIILLFGPTSGFIVSRLGPIKSTMFGSILTFVGFVGLLLFHSVEIGIHIFLSFLSAGLCLTSVGAMNVIILSTPREYSGVTVGISSLLRFIGCSIGPALAAMHLQADQTLLHVNETPMRFPSSISFDMVFSTAVIFSVVLIIISMMMRQRATRMSQYQL